MFLRSAFETSSGWNDLERHLFEIQQSLTAAFCCPKVRISSCNIYHFPLIPRSKSSKDTPDLISQVRGPTDFSSLRRFGRPSRRPHARALRGAARRRRHAARLRGSGEPHHGGAAAWLRMDGENGWREGGRVPSWTARSWPQVVVASVAKRGWMEWMEDGVLLQVTSMTQRLVASWSSQTAW